MPSVCEATGGGGVGGLTQTRKTFKMLIVLVVGLAMPELMQTDSMIVKSKALRDHEDFVAMTCRSCTRVPKAEPPRCRTSIGAAETEREDAVV